jgi:murein DD-endopeptidase MepM/ murein hydrolase activator NlpD
MADSGFFQINDIILDIPPEQISIKRMPMNYSYQALRTTSSIKVKSGYSQLDIDISVKFTSNNLYKLRDLVSQFRVTPFCYVENAHIRENVLGGNRDQNMALALKNMVISISSAGQTDADIIDVQFFFSWFNYFPFSTSFSFKRAPFSPIEVKDPKMSSAWKILYQAEQRRTEYQKISKLGLSETLLTFTEFRGFRVNEYNIFKRDVKAVRRLRQFMQQTLSRANDARDILPGMFGALMSRTTDGQDTLSNVEAEALLEEIFGPTTSINSRIFTNNKRALKDLAEILDSSMTTARESRFRGILDQGEWKPTELSIDGKKTLVRLGNEPGQLTDDDTRGAETIIAERQRRLTLHRDRLNSSDLILTGISISFQNTLAVMPVKGYTFPTFQHIGSTDAVVTLSFAAPDNKTLARLTEFNDTMQQQAVSMRLVPEGQRNIRISNDIINMCGLYEFTPDSLSTGTVPGNPHLTAITWRLLNNPITSRTSEGLIQSQNLTNNMDIKVQISEIIEKHLKVVPLDDLITVKDGKIFVTGRIFFERLNKSNYKASQSRTNLNSYFTYTGPKGKRHQAFEDICVEYGRRLSYAFLNLLGDTISSSLDNLGSKDIQALFSLTNHDILSIELLQNLIDELLNKGISSTISFQGPQAESFRETFQPSTEEREEFINEHLAVWQSWATKFIDNKILFTENIELPQFENIIEPVALQNNVTAYKDFPLEQVIEIMREDGELKKIIDKSMQDLIKKSSRQQIKLNSVNYSSLIGPDFYFFERATDTKQRILSRQVLESAKESIKASQGDQRAQAEEDWFRNVYEKRILGDNITEIVRKNKAYVGKGFFNSEIKSMFEERQSRDEVFYPSDLENAEEGLACSLQTATTSDEPITPPAFQVNNSTSAQPGYWIGRQRTSQSMSPPSYYAEAQHRFGLDALDFLSSKSYTNEIFKTGDQVEFGWPTGPETRRITSGFSLHRPTPKERDANGNPIIRSHKGMDLGSTDRSGSFGHPVLAAADGIVTAVSYSEAEKRPGEIYGGEGVRVIIKHKNGYVTKYYHLQWDDIVEDLSDRFWGRGIYAGGGTGSFDIYRGTRIGSVGDTGGISTAPHLHFEVWKDNSPIDPETIFVPSMEKLTEIPTDIDPNNESLLTKSVDKLEKDLQNGQTFGMKRAYPTYRLFFIESDIDERKRFAFDDFFGYSSVVAIELIRSRRIAADLLHLRITNVSGVLSNRKFRNELSPEKARDSKGNIAKEESSLVSMLLRPGVQIQLRLGYASNINDLETVFNGVITDVALAEGTDDMLDITCQSYGIELVQNTHGESKSFGGFFSKRGITGEIIEQLMASPELSHFGRWDPGQRPPLGELRSVLTERWTAVPRPSDDNIFAPRGRGIWGIFDKSPKFILYQSTIWDAFQELTLRHPSYVAYPVPYEGFFGPRMTMFFGLPDQLYFARDPSPRELNTASKLKKFAEEAKENTDVTLDKIRDPNIKVDQLTAERALSEEEVSNIQKAREFWLANLVKNYGLSTGIIRPFRNYHILTSAQHILKNQIKNSLYRAFNTATIMYSDDEPEKDDNSTTGLTFDDDKTYTMRCDAVLQDEEVREFFGRFPNCVGFEMVKRYCLSLLQQFMKDGYEGTITIIGNPSIKPHDVCYVFDAYSDMYGPIEVEQSVLSFSQQYGFITEITPDLCVHVNQSSTMATQDALGLIVEEKLSVVPTWIMNVAEAPLKAVSLLSSPIANMFFNSSEIGLGHEPTANPFKLIGGFIFSKFITRTQVAHPMRYSPLVKGGKPMLGGLPKQLDSTFIQKVGKYAKSSYKGGKLLLDDTTDKYSPGNWIGRTTGGFWKSVFNLDQD